MSNRSPMGTDDPFLAAIGILFCGPIAIVGLGVVGLALAVAPIVVLVATNAVLGVFALGLITGFGYVVAPQLVDSDDEPNTANSAAVDSLTELEIRYLRGELSDEAFDRHVQRFIELDGTVDRLNDDSTAADCVPSDYETETA